MNTPDPLPTQATPDPLKTVAAIPFYQSPVQMAQIAAFVMTLVALFPKIGTWLGVQNSDQALALVTKACGGVAVVVLLYGIVTRWFSKVQPLTITKKGAAANANTVAHIVATQATAAGQPLTPPNQM